jgi:DNA topoisomerase-2
MIPWYRGFRGSIEQVAEERFAVKGCIEKVNTTTLRITELPIGLWTNTYMDILTKLLEAKQIESFKNLSTDTAVCCEVKVTRKMMQTLEADVSFHKFFKLQTSISTGKCTERVPTCRDEFRQHSTNIHTAKLPVVTTGNMHLHSAEGTITRYGQPTDIIADFFPVRLSFYVKRKASLVERAAADLLVLDNKVRSMACSTSCVWQ